MIPYIKCKNQIKPSLYSHYYAEACNEWRGHFRGLAHIRFTAPKKRGSGSELVTVSNLTITRKSSLRPTVPMAMSSNHYAKQM